MSVAFSDVLPNSPLVENLEFLQTRALQLRATLSDLTVSLSESAEVMYNPWRRDVRKFPVLNDFMGFVRQKQGVLGPARVARILFFDVPTVTGPDAARRAPVGAPETWINGVISNIDRELNDIARRRETLISFAASAAAAVAALGSMLAAIIALFLHGGP